MFYQYLNFEIGSCGRQLDTCIKIEIGSILQVRNKNKTICLKNLSSFAVWVKDHLEKSS